ncbi:MAG: phosphoenolpyruvate--protein phosphotransferase [Planctomycetota bacterium]
MEIFKGIGVSPGVVVSTAVVLDAEDVSVPRRTVAPDAITEELQRIDLAVEHAIDDLTNLRDDMADSHGSDIGGIFDFHLGILRDKSILKRIRTSVETEQLAAESAVHGILQDTAAKFLGLKDKYFAERVKDVYDIERRLLRRLIGQQHEALTALSGDVAVIAHDLLPSQTAALDKRHVKGFATDVGGRTSHTAIVARAMNIPAVVGLGNATAALSNGDVVIIDGTRGMVIVHPDKDQIAEYRASERQQAKVQMELAKLRDLPAETADPPPNTYRVALEANIEFPAEISDAVEQGAEGIGLYRTEFLYLASKQEPSEEDHFAAYHDALQRLDGKPLTIRTLDLGADKYSEDQARTPEKNPFLGDRSIRMCLHDIPMFKRQLRAILRASAHGTVKVMFPMISTLMELRQAKMVLGDVMEELEDEGIPFDRDIPIGMMVEVPAAAFMAPQFAKEVDFFSIGTNDLIQYTLAVDRTNERVAGLFNPAHPAVLGLIRDVIRAAQRAKIPASVCGEMAGEPLYTLLLLGLGLHTFSMNGPDVPEVKKIIRNTTMDHARTVARKVMSFDSERQVIHYLREQTRTILPEAF